MGDPFCWIVRGIRHKFTTLRQAMPKSQRSSLCPIIATKIGLMHTGMAPVGFPRRSGGHRKNHRFRRHHHPTWAFSVARQRPTSLPFGLLMSEVYYAISFLIGVDLPITASYSQQAASPIGNQILRSLQLCCTNTPLTPDTGGFMMCCVHSSSPYFVSYCFRAKSKRSGYHLRPTSW